MLQDRQGTMWLGTAAGLLRLAEGAAGTRIPLPAGLAADSLAEGRDGTLWIATSQGLFTLRQRRLERVRGAGLETLSAPVILVDSQGVLWIGGRADGLYRYEAGRLKHYTPEDGLPGREVRGLATDRKGALWIATKDRGVSRLEGGRFTVFGPSEGLPSPAVQAIFVDRDGVVWAATRRGLVRIRDDRVVAVTAQSGLPANYYYQIAEDDQGGRRRSPCATAVDPFGLTETALEPPARE